MYVQSDHMFTGAGIVVRVVVGSVFSLVHALFTLLWTRVTKGGTWIPRDLERQEAGTMEGGPEGMYEERKRNEGLQEGR